MRTTGISMQKIFVTLLLVQTVSFAQPIAHLKISSFGEKPAPSGYFLQEIQSDLHSHAIAPVMPESPEHALLRGAIAAASRLIVPDLAKITFTGQFTMPSSHGDLMIAQWLAADILADPMRLWLWDSPDDTVFVAELDRPLPADQELAQFAERFIKWENIAPLQLRRYLQDGPNEFVLGPMPDRFGRCGRCWFGALGNQKSSLIGVGIPKSVLGLDYPPDTIRVPERFPPLRTRLASLTREQLFREIGRGFSGVYLLYPTERDRIIEEELLSRGHLTDSEVNNLMIGDSGNFQIVTAKTRAFLDAAEETGVLNQYASGLLVALRAAPVSDAGIFLDILKAMRSEHMDYVHPALEMLRLGRFGPLPLDCLREGIVNVDDLQTLVRLPLKPELEVQKNRVIEAVAERLKVPLANGSPK